MLTKEIKLYSPEEKTLSIYNILDYLRLIVWALFSPQSIRLYLKTHGLVIREFDFKNSLDTGFLTIFSQDKVRRLLLLQSEILIVCVTVFYIFLFKQFNINYSWQGEIIGTSLALFFGFLFAAAINFETGILSTVLLGFTLGPTFGFAGVIVGSDNTTLTIIVMGTMAGLAIGSLTSITRLIEENSKSYYALGLELGIPVGFVGGIVAALFISIEHGLLTGLSLGTLLLICILLGTLLMTTRVIDYFASSILILLSSEIYKKPYIISRTTWLPLPKLQQSIVNYLQNDFDTGMELINQLMVLTFQQISIVYGLRKFLHISDPANLIPTVDSLALKLQDSHILKLIAYFTPKQVIRLTDDGNLDLIGEDESKLVSAVYWYLSTGKLDEATQFTNKIKHLSYGNVLHGGVDALRKATLCKQLIEIANWKNGNDWLNEYTNVLLLSNVFVFLARIYALSHNISMALESASNYSKSTALIKADAELSNIVISFKSTPIKYPLLQNLVLNLMSEWQLILSNAIKSLELETIDKPIRNPFVVGNPVEGIVFVGRDEIYKKLDEFWGNTDVRCLPSVVLYGQRRMGKTSIVQNLKNYKFNRTLIIAQATMQMVVMLTNTGEVLDYLAYVLYDALFENNLKCESPSNFDFSTSWYHAFNMFIRSIRVTLQSQTIVLALDEFEVIEEKIKASTLEPEFLDYLRGLIQSEPWFILVLAGSHTLKEMTGTYWNPLFASVVGIKVGFLDKSAVFELLVHPSEQLPINFTQSSIDKIYEYVRGQPYLTQLIAYLLIRRFNQNLVSKKLKESRFLPEHVNEIVVSPEFYEIGSPYFSGIWKQVENSKPVEQINILRILAQFNEPVSLNNLITTSRLSSSIVYDCLASLEIHDIVLKTGNKFYFSVPLMRNWIVRNQLSKYPNHENKNDDPFISFWQFFLENPNGPNEGTGLPSIGNKLDLPLRTKETINGVLIKLFEHEKWIDDRGLLKVSMKDIFHWFQDFPDKFDRSEIKFGALLKVYVLNGSKIRIYQGVFNKDLECLRSRHLLVTKIDDALLNIFGSQDLIIFADNDIFSQPNK